MPSVYPLPACLPRNPPPYDQWKAHWPNCLKAYNLSYEAERHAKASLPLQEDAKNNVMFARVAGYLLLEFFNRRAVLSESPCKSLARHLASPPRNRGTSHDVVFQVGKLLHDHLLRMCTFGFGLSHGVRYLSLLAVRTSRLPYPAPTSHPSLPSFDNLVVATLGSMKLDNRSYGSSRSKVCAPLPSWLLCS